MDIKLFTEILRDKNFNNYKKMSYKYGEDFKNFLENLEELYYEELPLKDFDGGNLVFRGDGLNISQSSVKLLLKSQNESYGLQAAENEIISSSAIENIDFSRQSVRNILKGFAPKDEEENRILGQKKALEFISDTANEITEENIFRLYQTAIGEFLPQDDKLKQGNFYRHDSVYIVSDKTEHIGLEYKKLPQYMKDLVAFINADSNINDLVKAAIVHFYIAYIHPYFDGNGRMARLMHIWFLIRKGYESTLFLPFSKLICAEKKAYYDSFTLIENNKSFSGKIDVTPFATYFLEKIYNNMGSETTSNDTLLTYKTALKSGKITEKEAQLWNFVLSNYGLAPFSTKQLEKDFGNAAYATIRGFVLKFSELGLLTAEKFGNRVRYGVRG